VNQEPETRPPRWMSGVWGSRNVPPTPIQPVPIFGAGWSVLAGEVDIPSPPRHHPLASGSMMEESRMWFNGPFRRIASALDKQGAEFLHQLAE